MTSSGEGIMSRGHRITAPSLSVYGSLTATTKQIARQIELYKSHTLCLFANAYVQDVLQKQRWSLLFLGKKQEEGRGFGDISHPMGAVFFMCLFVIVWLFGVRV